MAGAGAYGLGRLLPQRSVAGVDSSQLGGGARYGDTAVRAMQGVAARHRGGSVHEHAGDGSCTAHDSTAIFTDSRSPSDVRNTPGPATCGDSSFDGSRRLEATAMQLRENGGTSPGASGERAVANIAHRGHTQRHAAVEKAAGSRDQVANKKANQSDNQKAATAANQTENQKAARAAKGTAALSMKIKRFHE